MIDQINELPEDGLKSSPETSHYTENKWVSQKNQNKLYFLHLADTLNDLLQIRSSLLNIAIEVQLSITKHVVFLKAEFLD